MSGNAFVQWAIGLCAVSSVTLFAIILKPKEALSSFKRKRSFVTFLILETLVTLSYIIYYYMIK